MKNEILKKIYTQHDIECNQKYGQGNTLPYSFHLKAVKAQGKKFTHLLGSFPTPQMEANIADLIEVALVGHDLIEDGRMTPNDIGSMLQSQGLSVSDANFVTKIIFNVTDEKGMSRGDRKNEKYYKELKENRAAVFVKLADIAANMLYSKMFNTRQYAMYKVEFGALKGKLWGKDLDEMFVYVGSL